MKEFLLSFIPIFVAMDAIGILPMFIGFTEHLKSREKQKIINQSIITAFLIGIVFLFLGKWIFKILGVQVSDFKIAGGTVLLAISLRDILQYEKSHKLSSETMGAMPNRHASCRRPGRSYHDNNTPGHIRPFFDRIVVHHQSHDHMGGLLFCDRDIQLSG